MVKQKSIRSNKKRRDRGVYRPFKRRSEVGGLPGKIDAHVEAHPTTINYVSFDRQSLDEQEGLDFTAFQKISFKQDRITWIDVIGLSDSRLIEWLGKRYGIHALLLEDITHTHQRPKVEIQDGKVALILRMVDAIAPLASEQVSFVLSGSTVITFQERNGDSFHPVRRRIRQGLGTIRSMSADYTMYSLIDAVVDGFFPLLEDYGKTLEQLEDAIDAGINNEVQGRVHSIRSELSQLRKITWSHREAMQRLVTDAADLFSPSTIPFLRDCLDHTGQILDVTETFRDVAGDIRDLYFAQLSQRTNDVMKFLTIISTIFMPLSFIAGVYGMNFNYEASPYNMPETQARFGYPIVMFGMALTAVVMLFYFYRKGWIFSNQ